MTTKRKRNSFVNTSIADVFGRFAVHADGSRGKEKKILFFFYVPVVAVQSRTAVF